MPFPASRHGAAITSPFQSLPVGPYPSSPSASTTPLPLPKSRASTPQWNLRWPELLPVICPRQLPHQRPDGGHTNDPRRALPFFPFKLDRVTLPLWPRGADAMALAPSFVSAQKWTRNRSRMHSMQTLVPVHLGPPRTPLASTTIRHSTMTGHGYISRSPSTLALSLTLLPLVASP
jgi:hypothetical protein